MIDAYEFGRIVIDGKVYKSDVIILPDRVDASWWRKEGHNLRVEDIESVMKEEPNIVIVGTGMNGRMQVPDRTRRHIESKGADLIVEPTRKACELYNQVPERRKVVAALHLTC